MSKLLKLKEWLTLEDAARHLTLALDEPVSVSDILQLALDGQLTLSVDLVNHGKAKRRVIKSAEEAGTWKLPMPITTPEDLTPPDAQGRRRRRKDAPARGYKDYEFPAGTPLDDGRVLTYGDDTVHTITGVWDLAMLGGERIAVTNALQQLVNGPRAELVSIDGSFLMRPDIPDEVWSIQEQDRKRKTNPVWRQRLELGESTEGVEPYLEETETFYYPASGLPEGSALVVRVSHLQDFINGLQGMERQADLQPREENGYLAIIGALVAMMLEKTPEGGPRAHYKDRASIIEGIMIRYPDVPGLKKRNLEDKFAKGRRRIGD